MHNLADELNHALLGLNHALLGLLGLDPLQALPTSAATWCSSTAVRSAVGCFMRGRRTPLSVRALCVRAARHVSAKPHTRVRVHVKSNWLPSPGGLGFADAQCQHTRHKKRQECGIYVENARGRCC